MAQAQEIIHKSNRLPVSFPAFLSFLLIYTKKLQHCCRQREKDTCEADFPFYNTCRDLERGKKSKIFDYCDDPHRREQRCIWICRKRGRDTVAQDVAIDAEKAAVSMQLQYFNSDRG